MTPPKPRPQEDLKLDKYKTFFRKGKEAGIQQERERILRIIENWNIGNVSGFNSYCYDNQELDELKQQINKEEK